MKSSTGVELSHGFIFDLALQPGELRSHHQTAAQTQSGGARIPPRAPPVLNHPSLGSGEVINPRAVDSRVHNGGC